MGYISQRRRHFVCGLLLASAFVLAGPTAAMALTLDEARSAGLVGEQPDGYIGAVQPSAAATALVEQVNSARRQEYERLAAKHGVPLGTVAATAAQQLIEKLSPGQFYRNPAGIWVRK